MEKRLCLVTVLIMFSVCNFASAGNVNRLVKAIKTNNYDAVKKAFQDVREKNETNQALIERIRIYYKKNEKEIGAGRPLMQAKIATGERGDPEWGESLRALRELGFGISAQQK